jgi:hypothetical protein
MKFNTQITFAAIQDGSSLKKQASEQNEAYLGRPIEHT